MISIFLSRASFEQETSVINLLGAPFLELSENKPEFRPMRIAAREHQVRLMGEGKYSDSVIGTLH
jgi:hypothetical protein